MELDSLKRQTRVDRVEELLKEKHATMAELKQQEEVQETIKTYEVMIQEFKHEVVHQIEKQEEKVKEQVQEVVQEFLKQEEEQEQEEESKEEKEKAMKAEI